MYSKIILSLLCLSLFGTVFAQQIGDVVYSSDTHPVEEYSVNNIGLYLYRLQIQIGNHQLSGAMPLFQQDSFVLLSQIEDLSIYPLMESMRGSENKSQIYDQYLFALENMLYKVNAFQSQLSSEISLLSQDQSRCEQEKSLNQKLYNASLLDATPTTNLDSLLQAIQKSSACIAEKSSLITAKQELYDLINEKSLVISDKYTYLSNNRSTIIDHFGLLNADYLEDISAIQDDLKNY